MAQASAGLRERVFRVGSFRVDPQRNRIVGPCGEAVLQPKVMDVLCALAERHGSVVARGTLIDLVWGKEFGADESLTKAVSQLRKAFGSDAAEIIETIPKRGYRLLVAPRFEESASDAGTAEQRRRRWWLPATAALLIAAALAAVLMLRPQARQDARVPSARTGIVVTVEPLATDDRAVKANGFADDLSTALARSPLVRARTASAPEPVGADLLQYRVRGEIHRVGDRLQLSAQLLDGTSGEVLWGESYAWPYDAEFSARGSAVSAVARDLTLPLLRSAKLRLAAKPPLSLAPWELTLLVTWVPGDEFRPTEPPHEDSYWLQRRALELDPDYAPAHALYGELAAYYALFDPPSDTPQARQRSRHHIDRALELAPYDAEVLYQIALYYRFSGDRDRAAAMLKRVIELDPVHPLAAIDLDFVEGQCAAQSDAAIASLDAQVARLPVSSPVRWVALSHLSSIYLGRGDFDRARTAALASRRIIPMTWTAITLAAADVALGRDAEAAQAIAEHHDEWSRLNFHYFAEHIVSRWCLSGPRTAQAQAVFRRLAAVIEPRQK